MAWSGAPWALQRPASATPDATESASWRIDIKRGTLLAPGAPLDGPGPFVPALAPGVSEAATSLLAELSRPESVLTRRLGNNGLDALSVVLWIHGGCFTRGDSSWSTPFVDALTADGHSHVYTVDFPQGAKHPWPQALPALLAAFDNLRSSYSSEVPIVVGGESSGAFYAAWIAGTFPDACAGCIGVAPVLDPAKRHERLGESKRAMQEAYFGPNLQAASRTLWDDLLPRIKRCLCLLGANDTDATLCLESMPLGTTIMTFSGKSHADMCSRPGLGVTSNIVQWVDGVRQRARRDGDSVWSSDEESGSAE